MKLAYFPNYAAKNSSPVIDAFIRGCAKIGITVVQNDMSADVAMIWSQLWAGRMAGNRMIWNTFRSNNRPVIVLEVGMLKRNVTWKVGVNGTGTGCYNLAQTYSNRAAHLGVALRPWTGQGSEILIAVQRSDSQQWVGQCSMQTWLEQTIQTVRTVTDRPIAIRCHPRQKIAVPQCCRADIPIQVPGTYDDFDFVQGLVDIWAVINHNSGPGCQSIMSGVPAFVDRSSLAWPVAAGRLQEIETPRRPDRQRWLEQISHSEWTVDEIITGQPLHRLLPLINT